jgi:hypothetical protein
MQFRQVALNIPFVVYIGLPLRKYVIAKDCGPRLKMIRVTILLIFLTTISVNGQDSTLVKEFCNTFSQNLDIANIEQQILHSFDIINQYLERNPLPGDNPVQEGIRLQYRLARDLKRSCPNYTPNRVGMIPTPVFDLENKLTIAQIDSLSVLIDQINEEKDIHLYIVTIDDFYPDSTITGFSNRYREFWAPRIKPKKGVVLIVLSSAQREVRISTGDISMTYLTDEDCNDVLKIMTPHFKTGRYVEGLKNGVLAIKSRL